MRRELFRVTRFAVSVQLDGIGDRFREGELPRLEAALNCQEVFDSASGIARRYRRLEGENWDVEISPRMLDFVATGFRDAGDIQKSVSFFLSETRSVLGHCHFWAGEINGTAIWPLEAKDRRGGRPIGSILQSKTSKLTPAQLNMLPGEMWGSGISLLGGTDHYSWKIDGGPIDEETLMVSNRMRYPEPEPAKWPAVAEEIPLIEAHIKSAYEFLETDVQDFIEEFMP